MRLDLIAFLTATLIAFQARVNGELLMFWVIQFKLQLSHLDQA